MFSANVLVTHDTSNHLVHAEQRCIHSWHKQGATPAPATEELAAFLCPLIFLMASRLVSDCAEEQSVASA